MGIPAHGKKLRAGCPCHALLQPINEIDYFTLGLCMRDFEMKLRCVCRVPRVPLKIVRLNFADEVTAQFTNCYHIQRQMFWSEGLDV